MRSFLHAFLTFAPLSTLLSAGCGDPALVAESDVEIEDTTPTPTEIAVFIEEDAAGDPALDGDSGTDAAPSGPDVFDGDTDSHDTDADAADGATELLPDGETCTSDDVCVSGSCLLLGVDSGICVSPCESAEDCPLASDCLNAAEPGQPVARACVPRDYCIDRDEDGFGIGPGCAGPDCADNSDATFPGADEVCDGVDNDCDLSIDENPVDAGDACESASPGVCRSGVQTCVGGLLSCLPTTNAALELCNGLDDDCDGLVDEDYAVHLASCDDSPTTGCETDLRTSAAHCGRCDNACPEGVACIAGTCGCDGESIACDGACVAPNACGGCSSLSATPGSTCGSCGTIVCDGAEGTRCDDPGTNSCGGCEALSPAAGDGCGYCDTGSVTCTGADTTTCSGATSPLTDDNHCGECGNRCADGRRCVSGACACPDNQALVVSSPGNESVCVGEPAVFTAAVSGDGLRLQWEYYVGGTWFDVPDAPPFVGARTAALSIPATSPELSGVLFRLRADASCSSVRTNTGVLTVLREPTSVTATASPNPVCEGATLSLSASATGATNFRWSGPGRFLSTQQSPSVPSMSEFLAGTYQVTASNACGSASAPTAAVVVSAAPRITSQPTGQLVLAGTPAVFTAAADAAGGPVSWQWQESADGGPFESLVEGGVYRGTTTNELTIIPDRSMAGNLYRAIASNPCGIDLTNEAILGVGRPLGGCCLPCNPDGPIEFGYYDVLDTVEIDGICEPLPGAVCVATEFCFIGPDPR